MLTTALPKQIGPYAIVGLLGQGAMASVYRAKLSLMEGQDYSVKVLSDRCTAREVKTFLGECSKVRRLGVHPHIVLLHVAGLDRRLGRYYVVMEYVNGPTAAQLQDGTPGRQLPLERALRIAIHVALGLEHAHQRGVLHLDVKPSNILVQRDGEIAKITDFGNAQLIGEPDGPSYPSEVGTPAYMPWEQTRQGRQAGLQPDERSDVYALAATLYDLLTGHLACPAGQGQQILPRRWRPDLPEALETLLLQALSPEQKQRPATMYAFRRALERLLTPAQVGALMPLPRSAHQLVGRTAVLQQLKQRLLVESGPAQAALHGLPGVGKTTLALALVNDRKVREYFADGILWVGLGLRPNLSALLGAWGERLDMAPDALSHLEGIEAQAQAIHAAIGQRRLLLVIDDAWDVEAALTFKLGGPRCAHLVTTRLPEVALHFADPGASVVRVPELSEADSLELLARLAPEVVETEPAEALALAQAVDGLPLALTLMGRYLHVQGYGGQPRRLHSALDLLRQARERLSLAQPQGPLQPSLHQPGGPSLSLMASIGASYRALNKRARGMLLALSVFPAKPNSFSEEAALAVSAGSTRSLDLLMDSGLLESSGPGRYTLHQTIADYARLKRKSPRPARRLAEFFVAYAEAAQDDYGAFDREVNNILAGLGCAFVQNMGVILARGTNAAFRFFNIRGMYQVAETFLRQSQQALGSADDPRSLAMVWLHLGLLAQNRGDYTQAEACWQTGLSLARPTGDAATISSLLQVLGGLLFVQGDLALAETYLQEGLALARQSDHQRNICVLLRRLGALAERRNQRAEAEACYQESLSLARKLGDQQTISGLLIYLGMLADSRDEYAQAERYYQEALALARQMRYLERIGNLLNNLGATARMQGDIPRARAYHQEGLALARQLGQSELVCYFLINLGEIASTLKDYPAADTYYQEALALARQIGHPELLGILYSDLGELARERNDYAEAALLLQEGQSLAQQIHYGFLIAFNLNQWGELYLKQWELERAASTFHEMLALAREIESRQMIATALYGLARVAASLGNMAEARRQGVEGLGLLQAIGHYQVTAVAEWLTTLPQMEGEA